MRFKKRTFLACCLLSAVSLGLLFFNINARHFDLPGGAGTVQTADAGVPTAPETPPAESAPADTPSDGAVIEHNLPKEDAVPEIMYTAHFARSEMQCDCKPRASARGARATAEAGAEVYASGHEKSSQTAAGMTNEEYTNLKENSCDGFPVEMDPAFMAKLEELRNTLGRPVVVTSGVRCVTRNAEVGGIPNSWHLTGHAADIYCPGVPYNEVAEVARSLGFGVVEYANEQYCHIEYWA